MSTAARLFSAFLLVLCAAAGNLAFAQPYPNKAIRLLVPCPPGGPADILARIIAQRMTEGFGQQIIVDNRPGANTIIAAEIDAILNTTPYIMQHSLARMEGKSIRPQESC